MTKPGHIRSDIKQRAKRGDYTLVAGLVGLAPDTVRRIVSGARNNNKVLRRFVDYLDKRDSLLLELKEESSK